MKSLRMETVLGGSLIIVLIAITIILTTGGQRKSTKAVEDTLIPTPSVSFPHGEEGGPVRPEIATIVEWVNNRDFDVEYATVTTYPKLIKVIHDWEAPQRPPHRLELGMQGDVSDNMPAIHRLVFRLDGISQLPLLRKSEFEALAYPVQARCLREYRRNRQERFEKLRQILETHQK